MNEIEIAKYIYDLEPLNRFRNNNDIIARLEALSVEQNLNLLLFSFKHYDKKYNKSLCLTYTILWKNFKIEHWKKLILNMFPRKVKYQTHDFKNINTGSYFDVFLLNGIIGVSPFVYIFEELELNYSEKNSFFNYLKFYGEANFYYNERELIEDVVNFYHLEIFSDIVCMKEYLISSTQFTPSMKHSELLQKFIK